MDVMRNLSVELNAFCDAYRLPHESADELLLDIKGSGDGDELEMLQLGYLENFIKRWDIAVHEEMVFCDVAVWTPWAQIVCPACCNKADESRNISTEKQHFNGDNVFLCDECGVKVGFKRHDREMIDLCKLRDAIVMNGGSPQMEQTGGMCAALVQYFEDGRYAYVATCMDSERGRYELGMYECDPKNNWDGEHLREVNNATIKGAVVFFEHQKRS